MYNLLKIFISFILFIFIFFHNEMFEYFVTLVENHISKNGNITKQGIHFLKINFIYFEIFALTFTVFFLTKNKYYSIVYDNIYTNKIIVIKFLFIALLYIIYYKFVNKEYHFLYNEDGLFEYMTSALFFISAILFYLSSKYLLKYKFLYIVFIILMLISLFIFLEEISYGQRIFNFTTPDFLQKINHQNEINIHNIHNRGGEPPYIVVSYILYAHYSLSLLLRFFVSNIYARLLLFSHSDILLITFFSISSYFDAEATEFFISLLVFELSVRNYYLLKKNRSLYDKN